MPLIIEDEGKLLGKKQAKVPDKLVNKIKNNLNLFGQDKKSKGYKRASSIVDDEYNKRSKKKDKIVYDASYTGGWGSGDWKLYIKEGH